MIKKAQKTLKFTFKESFIPVLLVVVALGGLLVYVNFKAIVDADRIVTIEIQGDTIAAGMEELEGVNAEEVVEFSKDKSDDPLYVKAIQAVEQQHWKKAEEYYQQIIEKNPSSQAYNDLGALYYHQGKLQEALALYDRAINTVPVYVNAYLNRGVLNAKLGKHKQAIEDYNNVIQQIPHHFQAHFNMGIALLKDKDYVRAVEILEQASKQAGGQRKAKALYNLGMAYLHSGKEKKQAAEKAFTSAIRIRPDYVEARLALADMLMKTAEGRDKALQEINRVLELKPNYPPVYFRIALIRSDAGDSKAAQEAYIKAIQYNPQYAKARYNLGLSYLDEKRWADARAQFEWIREQDPKNALVHFQLGRAAYGEKDYSTALVEYQNALAIKGGKYEKALLNIGLVHSAQKHYDNAITAFKQVLELNLKYPQAWYNLGLVYVRQEKYESAEQALLKAIEYDRKYAQAWFNLGVLYTKTNKNDQAIESYLEALAIRPAYRKAQLNLAVRYAKRELYDKSIELYKAVLDKDQSYAAAWLNLGIAYFKKGQDNDAEVALLKALELEPDSVRARRFLARIYVAKKEFTVAIKLLQEALDRKADSTNLRIQLSNAYKEAGRIREAKSELQKALKLEPGNENIKKELVEIQKLS